MESIYKKYYNIYNYLHNNDPSTILHSIKFDYFYYFEVV